MNDSQPSQFNDDEEYTYQDNILAKSSINMSHTQEHKAPLNII